MARIVRSSSVSLFMAAWLLAGTAGCGGGGQEPRAAPGGSRFGASYEIVLSESPATPDEPPALRGDTLALTVAYPGGEETHDFSVGHEVAGDTARLWLRHDAAGEDDSTRVTDEVRLPLPASAREQVEDASTVVLLNPQQGDPFILRWVGE